MLPDHTPIRPTIPEPASARFGPRLLGLLAITLAIGDPAPRAVLAQEVRWTQRTVIAPSARFLHAMAHDTARGVTVLFGGSNGDARNSESWEWTGAGADGSPGQWTERLVSGPSPRRDHAMAFDAARGVTVLFGGINGSTTNDHTWEWNGTAWTQRAVSGPSARYGHAMAYDAARGVTVLHGGWTGGTYSHETWEWNGTTWTRRALNRPSARAFHSMTYDAARGVTVLYGGTNAAANYAETWEWNGTAWVQRFVAGPSARYYHAMVYDAARGVTVLFGGRNSDTYFAETWEWSGAGDGAWIQRALSGPSARSSHAMAYDAGRAVTVLFGGHNNGVLNAETWELIVPCPSDLNQDGIVNSQDFCDFLAAFFNADTLADFNHDGGVHSQDFFDFLAAFFAGC